MSWFKKKRDNYDSIDFTELQKRKILKEKISSEGIIDMNSSASSVNSSSGSDSNFGFLSNLARAGSVKSNNLDMTKSPSISDSLREARRKSMIGTEINELRIKLEDNEYKLSNLVDKVRQLEEKLRAFEVMR